MNDVRKTKREEKVIDIFCMVLFGSWTIATFVAGCCGAYHQFGLSALCAILTIGFYLDKKEKEN